MELFNCRANNIEWQLAKEWQRLKATYQKGFGGNFSRTSCGIGIWILKFVVQFLSLDEELTKISASCTNLSQYFYCLSPRWQQCFGMVFMLYLCMWWAYKNRSDLCYETIGTYLVWSDWICEELDLHWRIAKLKSSCWGFSSPPQFIIHWTDRFWTSA